MAESIPISIPTYDFSVETYHKMIDFGILQESELIELIEGNIVVIDCDKTPLHAATICKLNDILRAYFKSKIIICDQKAITLGTHSEPEPDIAVVKFREDYYEEAHPQAKDILMVIEVSFTTQKYDRETKMPLYASYGISEAWIVDLKKKVIEVYEKPVGEEYTIKNKFGLVEILKSSFIESLAVKRVIKK